MTTASVKKKRIINKNAIIFPAEYNPRRPEVNAIIKRNEHILQCNTVLKSYFPRIRSLLQVKEQKCFES